MEAEKHMASEFPRSHAPDGFPIPDQCIGFTVKLPCARAIRAEDQKPNRLSPHPLSAMVIIKQRLRGL
jgi:hypothetical protein